MSADRATAMTPRKKEIFSRVLTTLVDCQVAASVVIRVETCIQTSLVRVALYGYPMPPHLELELLHLLLEVDGIPKLAHGCLGALESFFSAGLELVSVLLETSLEKIKTRVKVRLNGICGAASMPLVPRHAHNARMRHKMSGTRCEALT